MSGGPSNRTGAMHRLMVDALTAEAVGRLGAAGCPNLILRGPVLARELYADGTLRRYVDVDLLVAPTDLERAGAALRAAGFDLRRDHRERPLLAEPHAQEWRRRRHEHVDLHWRLTGAGAAPTRAWKLLSAHAQPITVGDMLGVGLDRAGLAVVVTLHAAHHSRNGETLQKALEDLSRALTQFDLDTWTTASDLALAIEAHDVFRAGLSLTPQGEEIARQLGLPRVPARLQREMSAPRPGQRGLENLADARTVRGRTRALRPLLLPPAATMRESFS